MNSEFGHSLYWNHNNDDIGVLDPDHMLFWSESVDSESSVGVCDGPLYSCWFFPCPSLKMLPIILALEIDYIKRGSFTTLDSSVPILYYSRVYCFENQFYYHRILDRQKQICAGCLLWKWNTCIASTLWKMESLGIGMW